MEIGNTPVWVLPNIQRLEQVRDTKFGTNVSNKILLNAAKCQGYSFYRFSVIKGKPTGRAGVKFPLPQIRLKRCFNFCHVTKVSVQKYSRIRRKIIKLGKTWHSFVGFLVTLILSMQLITKFVTIHFNQLHA